MSFSRFFRLFCIACALVLMLGLGLKTAAAQTDAKAPVIVNGRVLFSLSTAGQVSSQERAAITNKRLKETVETSEPVQVTVDEQNQSPTLLLNGQYLLTVTNQDTAQGTTPKQEADLWAQKIQQALEQAQQDRSPDAFRQMATLAVGILAATLALHWLFGNLTQRLLRLIRQRLLPAEDAEDSQSPMVELFFKLALALARFVLWTSVALYIANLFPRTRQWSYQITNGLLTSFTAPILNLGEKPYSILTLLILGGFLLGWAVAAGTLTNIFKTRVLGLAGIGRGAQEAIAVLIRYALIILGTVVLLQVWGLDLSSLTILASALGLGIGLGLQNIAKNFSSGLVLVFERPIQVGDFVEVGKFRGTVERIGPRSTDIRTLDFVSIIVPNSRFLEEEIINWSHKTPMSRLHLPVGVSYDADPREVEVALIEAANQHSKVLSNPEPRVAFIGFGDSSLDFELLVWVADPSKQFFLKSDLYFKIFEVLSSKNIEIPFPQRDLNFRGGFPIKLSDQADQVRDQLGQGSETTHASRVSDRPKDA